MKKVLVLALVLVMTLTVGAFAFQNEPDGFRGVEWGETPHWRYMEIGETESSGGYYYTKYPIGLDEEVTWCTWKNDKLYIGPAELGSIRYVFYEDRFMEVQIWVRLSGLEDLKSVLTLKFGKPQEIQSKPFRHADYGETERVTYVWIGEKAGIEFEVLLKWYGYGRDRYLSYAPKPGFLRIYSLEISNEFEKVMKRKREEAYRKKEQAIIDGLDNFDYIPEAEEEKKEFSIKEKLNAEKSKKLIFNGEKASNQEEIKPILPEVQPFFDFSTPENTLRTFWEAAILRDKELMEQCWSKEIPRHMLDEISEGMESIFADYDLEERKSFLGKITYKVDRYTDDTACYVYAINEEEESRIKFKVKKEEGQWKIIMPIEEEENEESGKDPEEREGIRGSGQGPEIEGAIAGREIRRWVEPGFPRSAEDLVMRDGKVRVKIWVLSSGEVVETAIIQTSNVPEFDQNASQALRKCRFESIEEQETQTGIVTFRFKAE